MPKIEIELSKSKDNDEIGEMLHHQGKMQGILMQIERLAGERDEALMSLNRVVRSSINEAKLKREDIRDIAFPPFIYQGRQMYQVINGKLTITIADPENKPVANTEIKEV